MLDKPLSLRNTALVFTMVVAGATACTSPTAEPCDPALPALSAVDSTELAVLPDDSLLTAVIRWVEDEPADKQAWLEERGAEVLHVFHSQPWVLFTMSAAGLRDLAEDETVEVRLSETIVSTSNGTVCS